MNSLCDVRVHCLAPSGPSPVSPVCVVSLRSCAKPLSAYLFSLRAETPSLWTNTFRKTSAPPQNHFYHWPRQYMLTKGLKRPGPHASTGTHTHTHGHGSACVCSWQRKCTGKMCKCTFFFLLKVVIQGYDRVPPI